MREFLSGWWETLIIRFRYPELYQTLKDWTDTDLFEVGPPE